MELDRQSIEKRDFPISRRGYDPAAVDAHLRALAVEIDELLRELESRGGESLGSTAGAQVQSILEAAETTAANIEQQADEDARRAREEAASDAAETRERAIAQAQTQVQAVSQATAVLLERVESMDGEVGALVQSLRDGAGRLAADLGSVETNMGELYDAAAGRGEALGGESAGGGTAGAAVRGGGETAGGTVDAEPSAAAPAVGSETGRSVEARPARNGTSALAKAPSVPAPATAPSTPASVSPPPAPPSPPPAPAAQGAADAGETSKVETAARGPVGGGPRQGAKTVGDVDGARLIALNMALNGEPREQAERYLAENFELPDRAKLLDEVYAAIEG